MEEDAVKAYWITAGVGTLVAVMGLVLWFVSDHKLGIILILTGLVVACLGLVMRIVEWSMAKSKPRSEM